MSSILKANSEQNVLYYMLNSYQCLMLEAPSHVDINFTYICSSQTFPTFWVLYVSLSLVCDQPTFIAEDKTPTKPSEDDLLSVTESAKANSALSGEEVLCDMNLKWNQYEWHIWKAAWKDSWVFLSCSSCSLSGTICKDFDFCILWMYFTLNFTFAESSWVFFQIFQTYWSPPFFFKFCLNF